MIKHIVLFSFKKHFTSKQIQSIFDTLKNLSNHIPEILSFSGGVYDSHEGLNKNYTHGFIMEFNNSKERDDYLNHPEHKRVVTDVIIPALEDGLNSVVAFDYAC